MRPREWREPMTTVDRQDESPRLEVTALDRARALARAIGESAAFRAFETAHEALEANADLRAGLAAYQMREQQLRLSRAWGGADPEDERALEREWQVLANQPALAADLAARQKLLVLLREVGEAISDGVGLDFGVACAPAGGCC